MLKWIEWIRRTYMNENNKSGGIIIIRMLFIIHTVFYLLMNFIKPIFLMVIYLRCFYIPYITAVILSIIYIWMIKKQNDSTPDFLIFIITLIINIISLMLMEMYFQAAMGI